MDLMKKEDTFISVISEMEGIKKMCEMLMKTPHYQKIGSDGIYAIVAKAKALNIDPIHALNGGFYFVQGRVGMSTEMMASLVRQAGHSVTMDERSSSTCCILKGKRKDTGDTWIARFSIEDAKRAGIYKEGGPWGKYPDVMCYNRAMSKMFRQLFPDLAQGAGYVKEELEEIEATEIVESHSKMKEITFKEEEKKEFITEQQQNDLAHIFSECDPTYIEDVWKTLRKQPMNINQMEAIPSNLFERIVNAATKNRDQYLSLRKEVNQDTMVEEISQEI